MEVPTLLLVECYAGRLSPRAIKPGTVLTMEVTGADGDTLVEEFKVPKWKEGAR